MSLGEREDELLDTLEAVIDADLPYVLVGGWAIAAFKLGSKADSPPYCERGGSR